MIEALTSEAALSGPPPQDYVRLSTPPRQADGSISMTWPDYRARRCWTDRAVQLTPWEADAVSMLLIRRGRPVPSADLIAIATPRCRNGLRSESSLRAMISGLNAKLNGLIRSDRRRAYYIPAPGPRREVAGIPIV